MHAERLARLSYQPPAAAKQQTPPLLDAFLISALPNIRYLTGFTGSNALLLATPRRATLFTDPRYTTQAEAETGQAPRIVKGHALTHGVAAEIARRKLVRIGFERHRLPWSAWNAIREKLPLGAELVAVDDAVERLRMVKSSEELTAIRASVNLNSQALERAMKRFRPGMRETELAAEIDYQMRRLGASGPAFSTIVATADHAALPHASPSARRIEPNRLLLIDMGACLDGYASDMTRTFAVGKVTPKLRRLYAAVLEAQQAAIAAVRPGIAAHAVDQAARKVLARHGLDKQFIHSTGHGLGLEIHEAPRLGRKEKMKLEAGMAITIEPGVYLPGVAGIRIEDTVLVTERGVEVLTPTSKELVSLSA